MRENSRCSVGILRTLYIRSNDSAPSACIYMIRAPCVIRVRSTHVHAYVHATGPRGELHEQRRQSRAGGRERQSLHLGAGDTVPVPRVGCVFSRDSWLLLLWALSRQENDCCPCRYCKELRHRSHARTVPASSLAHDGIAACCVLGGKKKVAVSEVY